MRRSSAGVPTTVEDDASRLLPTSTATGAYGSRRLDDVWIHRRGKARIRRWMWLRFCEPRRNAVIRGCPVHGDSGSGLSLNGRSQHDGSTLPRSLCPRDSPGAGHPRADPSFWIARRAPRDAVWRWAFEPLGRDLRDRVIYLLEIPVRRYDRCGVEPSWHPRYQGPVRWPAPGLSIACDVAPCLAAPPVKTSGGRRSGLSRRSCWSHDRTAI